jgi:hypothetical protein
MILKKQEKGSVIKAMYDSSNILASIYDKETKDLTIIFNKGTQYKYPNVKTTDYTRFELAESQGQIFNSHIKSYSFEKLDAIDPSNILDEVSDIKEAESKAKLKDMSLKLINKFTSCVSTAQLNDNMLDPDQLTDLQAYITVYISEITKQDE